LTILVFGLIGLSPRQFLGGGLTRGLTSSFSFLFFFLPLLLLFCFRLKNDGCALLGWLLRGLRRFEKIDNGKTFLKLREKEVRKPKSEVVNEEARKEKGGSGGRRREEDNAECFGREDRRRKEQQRWYSTSSMSRSSSSFCTPKETALGVFGAMSLTVSFLSNLPRTNNR